MNAASTSSKGTILVVDDNRLVLATLSDGLTRAGYHVWDADNGDDAILIARAQRPQLALLDIRMEGKSGFDVAHYLRHQCGMPFMFLSAFSDEQTVAQVKALGAVAYLVKPLDIKQIVPAVEAAFAHIETQVATPTVAADAAPPAAAAGAHVNDTSAARASTSRCRSRPAPTRRRSSVNAGPVRRAARRRRAAARPGRAS